MTEKQKSIRPQWREAVAGACAGAFSKTCMAPVERIKLLKQLQGSVDFAKQKSAWRVAIDVYKEQGLLSFWRGNLPNVMRTAGTAAINFTCMDYYKRVFVGPLLEQTVVQRRSTSTFDLERRRKFLSSFISGGLAGATSTTVLYPFEFLRTRLAMDVGKATNRQYTGMRNVVQVIWKSDGIFGFYQGYGVALTGGIFYRVLYLGGYDAFKTELLLLKQKEQPLDSTMEQPKLSWAERIGLAQTVSLTAGTLSYPFDSVRRRMMMQAGQPLAERRYRNSLHCIRVVWMSEGIRGFFLGLAPNIVRSMGGAILLVAYDSFRTML